MEIVIKDGLVKSLEDVPASEAGKPGFDGDDWNQYKAACECCLSLVKANGETALQRMRDFFADHCKSESWQMRNAALISFAGLLNERTEGRQRELLVKNQLEELSDLLDDPVIEVRSSAAFTLSQVAIHSVTSLLEFG